MLKRPLDPQFNVAVWEGRKTTTIRDTPWPAHRPIMLYNWQAKPYASPHVDVCEINVTATHRIRITHTAGQMAYECATAPDQIPRLQITEGFPTREAMDAWFRAHIREGAVAEKYLHTFHRSPGRTQAEVLAAFDKAIELATEL
jgi:hypothetical protein